MTTLTKRGKPSERDMFDPFIEGYDAGKTRVPRSSNPYRDCDAARLWDDGWLEAEVQGTRCKSARLAI
jgi:ribosome modulation factor